MERVRDVKGRRRGEVDLNKGPAGSSSDGGQLSLPHNHPHLFQLVCSSDTSAWRDPPETDGVAAPSFIKVNCFRLPGRRRERKEQRDL